MEPRYKPGTDLDAYRNWWGVPNWKNEEEYEYTSHSYTPALKNDQLRWEFVRRLESYRINWNDIYFCRSEFNLIEPINPSIRGSDLGDRNILFIDTVLRGGLVEQTMPHFTDEDQFVMTFGKSVLEYIENGFLILGFDPSLPETPQFNRAIDIFNMNRTKRAKQEKITERLIPIEHPSHLLRVLDAHNENITDIEISRFLYLITGDDSATKTHARITGRDRIQEAKTCWKRAIPTKSNVLL